MTDLNILLKSALALDPAPVVLCDLKHRIAYMNPAAMAHYEKQGGAALVGASLMGCHNDRSRQRIERVIAWFAESPEHNRIYTFRNERENKDVYMMALRDEAGQLVGYWEKHEYRNVETAGLYDFARPL